MHVCVHVCTLTPILYPRLYLKDVDSYKHTYSSCHSTGSYVPFNKYPMLPTDCPPFAY